LIKQLRTKRGILVPNLFSVVYVGDPIKDPWSSDVFRRVNEWLWNYTILGRLKLVDASSLTDDLIKDARLVFLELGKEPGKRKALFGQIRAWRPDVPVCVIRGIEPVIRYDDSSELEKEFPKTKIIRESGLPDKGTPDLVPELQYLLPPPILKTDVYGDPEIRGLSHRIGDKRFPFYIRTYFPEEEEKDLDIKPVRGGWSGSPLCRVVPGGGKQQAREYYLKFFFDDEAKFTKELDKHKSAAAWLDQRKTAGVGEGASVGLRGIPDFDGPVQQAFPSRGGEPVYAICYESASADKNRVTLKQLYADSKAARDKSDAARGLGAALRLLLDVLRLRQPRKTARDNSDAARRIEAALRLLLDVLGRQDKPQSRAQSPWSSRDEAQTPQYFCPKMRLALLDCVHDLEVYWPAICGDWGDRALRLRNLVYDPELPAWLKDGAVQVMVGHVHGDPNARNCLVNPDTGGDLLLIDCGGYRPDGPLVSDLAMIERDIKLVLMSTDSAANPFLDLDVGRLREWCAAEEAACEARLSFTPEQAGRMNASDPVRKAYRLVGMVRQRARKWSEYLDEEARHYFAALLYWTLRLLDECSVRPTKKLLALYSASEILRRFAR
jgi:hypothetical protein